MAKNNEHQLSLSNINNTAFENNLSQEEWKKFSDWIYCICIVTFDLELGQSMELIYPSHIKLSEQEKTNICYLAFPDSHSGCIGDTQFHIKLRVEPGTENTLLSFNHQRFNSQCIPVQKADKGHFWGFVYFRQMKDNSLPRGYFQKSFIILTRLPFFKLFYEVCALIAPRYFTIGLNALQLAYKDILEWPSLRAGQSYTFTLLGTSYQTYIPKSNSKTHNRNLEITENESANNKNLNNTNSLKEINNIDTSKSSLLNDSLLQPKELISVHEIDIFISLSSFINHIHMLWELVLVAEPIVVMGTSPTYCAHMVQTLISLISPLPYCAEFRPYFTIHDSEFKEFTQNNSGPPAIIVGVTNPFFTKLLQNWPHIIRLCEQQINDCVQQTKILNLTNNSTKFVGHTKLKRAFNSKALDQTPGIYTKYKPFLQKDKAIIKKIIHGIKTKRPQFVQSAIIRRYLLELTQSFMIPLERYMASLMPLQKDISPFKAAPKPHQFKQNAFLSTLEQSGPHLTSPLKGDWEGLYKRFFQSPNFIGWFENRNLELRQTLQALQLQALSDADLNKWAQGKDEVEIVDMILKLKQKLKIYSEGCENDNGNGQIFMHELLKNSTRNQLLQHLENMKQSLPDDLKTILDNA